MVAYEFVIDSFWYPSRCVSSPAVTRFVVDVPEERIERIRSGLWIPDSLYAPDDDQGWSYGVDLEYLKEFVAYWRNKYNWRVHERRLNEWPQFKVRIGDVDVHFYHIRGSGKHALPLILTHGWPGSVLEFFGVIDRLAHPERFGGKADGGFDLVIPSLPGYGFSSRPAVPIGPRKIAQLWRILMVDLLGYERFGAQGGDWGSAVTNWLGREHADVVAAIHLNLLSAPPRGPADDSETIQWRDTMSAVRGRESAYMNEHVTKPQTIGLALSMSPVGFAAWVLEKFWTWGDTREDLDSRFHKDDLITNLMIYLVNDAVASSIWLYRGAAGDPRPSGRIDVPTGCALFPAEFLPPPPRSAVERAFNVKRWTRMKAGGHFAALEEPEAFAEEIRAFFCEFSP